MDAYEGAQARLKTGVGAEPRTTFEKKHFILKGEVFFLDKDLLMGADHEKHPFAPTAVQCNEKQFKR